MKKILIILISAVIATQAKAFEWSAQDYLKNCQLNNSNQAQQKYCVGALKGAFTGLMVSRTLTASGPKALACLSSEEGNKSFEQIQQQVLVQMQSKADKGVLSAKPSSAETTLVLMLLEQYSCLNPNH
ncbi:hypothetical protein [Paraferrimonas sp. SM1919]|uniref:hypothetical protein n=1 Tax=Paraferrimonas sp. SM1919 TaxID=2662263 RepID=UPI0013D4AB16|nr:hypothetical protein [Paraferrimonas sp. SM1919]